MEKGNLEYNKNKLFTENSYISSCKHSVRPLLCHIPNFRESLSMFFVTKSIEHPLFAVGVFF